VPLLALRDDVGTIAALLVSDRDCAKESAKPCRLLDGGVDLGDTPIEVGNGLALNSQTSVDIGGSVCKCQIDGHHMFEVGACKEAEHADRVQAHQNADHRDENQAQKRRRRVPMLG
jgi:hypothetical protein